MFNYKISGTHQRTALSASILLCLLTQITVAQADTSYNFTNPLGNTYDPASATYNNSSYFNGINDSGVTVGNFTQQTGHSVTISGVRLVGNDTYGFVGNGLFNPSGSFLNNGAYSNQVTGINTTGAITGSYYTSSSVQTSFIASSVSAAPQTVYDTSNASIQSTYAQGLNDTGLVVGYNTWLSGNNTGFVFNSGSSTVDGIAAGAYADFTGHGDTGGTELYAVNNSGIAVGYVDTGANATPTGLILNVSTGATLLELNMTTASNGVDVATYGTYITGINLGAANTPLAGKDEIVGFWVDASSIDHGFAAIFNPTTDSISSWLSQNIMLPGAGNGGNTQVNGVNDSGTLVGQYNNATTGVPQGFTATPAPAAVPLPGAVWLMSSALAGMGWFGRRRASRA